MISDIFHHCVNSIQETALQGSSIRIANPNHDLKGIYDLKTIHKNLSRQEIEKEIIKKLNEEKDFTTGQLEALQTQLEWVAQLERAYILRFKSSIRSKIQAHARRKLHTTKNGIFGTLYVSELNKIEAASE